MSGASSRRKRSTMPIRARTELTFQLAILSVVTGSAYPPRCRLQSKGPRSGGIGARADRAFVTQGDRCYPGNRGKPRQNAAITTVLRLRCCRRDEPLRIATLFARLAPGALLGLGI